MNSSAWVYGFRHKTCWNGLEYGQHSQNCVKSLWREYVSVLNFMNISPMIFLAHVHTFRQPTCQNYVKIGQNSPICEKFVKSLWECMKEYVTRVWKYHKWHPTCSSWMAIGLNSQKCVEVHQEPSCPLWIGPWRRINVPVFRVFITALFNMLS